MFTHFCREYVWDTMYGVHCTRVLRFEIFANEGGLRCSLALCLNIYIYISYFVCLHNMRGKISTFEHQANMSAKMIIIKVTIGLTKTMAFITARNEMNSFHQPGHQVRVRVIVKPWSWSCSWKCNGQHWRRCHTHSHDHYLGLSRKCLPWLFKCCSWFWK